MEEEQTGHMKARALLQGKSQARLRRSFVLKLVCRCVWADDVQVYFLYNLLSHRSRPVGAYLNTQEDNSAIVANGRESRRDLAKNTAFSCHIDISRPYPCRVESVLFALKWVRRRDIAPAEYSHVDNIFRALENRALVMTLRGAWLQRSA